MISIRVAQEVKYEFSLLLAVMEEYLPGQGHSSLLCHNEITATEREKTGSQFNSQDSNHNTASLCGRCSVTHRGYKFKPWSAENVKKVKCESNYLEGFMLLMLMMLSMAHMNDE